MPYQTNGSFPDAPDPETVLWRYMDIYRFLAMLQQKRLHFSRADLMADPWEGSYGGATRKRQEATQLAEQPRWGEQSYIDLQVARNRHRFESFKDRRRTNWISCWTEAPHESMGMWAQYTTNGQGVAIKTTWGRLTESLNGGYAVSGSRVQYPDYEDLNLKGDRYKPFLTKRPAFRDEREVRLMILDAEFDGPYSEVVGIPVDLDCLIDSVITAPDPLWTYTVLEQVFQHYGGTQPILQSELDNSPYV